VIVSVACMSRLCSEASISDSAEEDPIDVLLGYGYLDHSMREHCSTLLL